MYNSKVNYIIISFYDSDRGMVVTEYYNELSPWSIL